MGSMMGGVGMGWAMFAVMGVSTLLLLALLVLTVFGIVWLARHLSWDGRGPRGEHESTTATPHCT